MKTIVSTLALGAALLAGAPVIAAAAAPAKVAAVPTAAEADKFIADAEAELRAFSLYGSRIAWVNATYITDDTDALAAKVGTEGTEMGVRLAKGAARFNATPGLSYDTRRQLDILKLGLTLPAPDTPGAAAELATIGTRMQSSYGKGKGTVKGVPTGGNDIEALMATSRDPAVTAEMWQSWHKVGAPMRSDYARMVEISNQGARELGYKDVGAMWRAGYDMDPDAFAAMQNRLLDQLMPLYTDLHCFTRTQLNKKYGDAVQKNTGPIRADLLGNMWAQDWSGIYDVVAPPGAGAIGFDTGELLTAKGYDPLKMVKTGEGFFSSMGFAPLPATFYERSQITKPLDREVICHASAWNLDSKDDLRIKMCTKVNATDFVTIHHELGHNYYQRAYNKLPFLYQNSANDGFHEALGDFVGLSVTPEYLVQIGLLDPAKVPDASKDIGLLLRQAMEKVPGMPWTYVVDKWRWGVFSGETPASAYNASWTDLREQYQGITPPVARSEADFDAGAKYHVPAGVPYARYFLARVLQFQFYQAACKQAGWTGPLHRCSIYNNKEVGTKLNAMMAMGASKPWPDALEKFTGSREMDAGAVLAYFAPLQVWLKAQNKGQQCGWSS